MTCRYTGAATLPAGQVAAAISLVVLVNSSTVVSITNTAIACSGTIGSGANSCGGGIVDNGTPDPSTANNTSSAGSSPAVDADLTITKSHTGNFTSGADGTYALTVTNKGPADSVGNSSHPITAVDTLPTGETFISASGTNWTCSDVAQIVTCTYPQTIVADTSAPEINLAVAVGSAASLLGTLTNSAQVTPGVTSDPNSFNNTASDATTIVGADLSITKSHVGTFFAGEQGTYNLTVTNGGPGDSAGPITVTDTLPSGESYVSASGSGWTCSDGSDGASAQVTCTGSAPLASGMTAPVITIAVAVAGTASGTLTNTAQVIPGPTADPVLANNTTSDATTVVVGADLAIVKSHTDTFILGSDGTYELAVTNDGPAVDTGPITVTDTLPDGLTFVSASGSGWTCSGTAMISCVLSGALDPAEAAPAITVTAEVEAAPIRR